MKIEEILNDNAVVCYNDDEKSCVVLGRGIAFHKEKGEDVEAGKMQREFFFASREVEARFKKIVTDIPMEYIILSDRIIRYAKETYAKKLDDSIYVTLTEHIYRMIGRQSYGFQLKNALRWEISHIYREEFLIGKKAVQMIQRQCMSELHEDEAAFIALHFVNAELNGNIDNIVDVTKVIQSVLQIIKIHFKIEYKEESLNYSRFITHLKFLGQRMFSGKHTPDNSDDEMFKMMREKYTDAYETVQKVKAMLSEEFEYDLNEEEQFYMLIHIVKVIKG